MSTKPGDAADDPQKQEAATPQSGKLGGSGHAASGHAEPADSLSPVGTFAPSLDPDARVEVLVPYRTRYTPPGFDYLAPTIAVLTGYTAEEVREIGFTELVLRAEGVEAIDARGEGRAPSLNGQTVRDVRAAEQAGKVAAYRAVYLVRTRSGRLAWLADRSRPWHDEDGSVIGAQGVMYDVTARREALHALRFDPGFSDALFETVGALIVVLDVDGRIVRFNRACEDLTGYAFEEVEGQPFYDVFLTPEDRGRVIAAFYELIRGDGDSHSRFENHWRTRAGDLRWIVWSNAAVTDADGKTVYIVATGIDLTQEQRAQQERDRFFELSRDLMAVVTHDGRLQRVNPAWEGVLGYTPGEFTAMTSLDLLHPDDRARAETYLRHVAGGQSPPPPPLQLRMRHRDGSYRWFSGSAVRHPGLPLLYATARDITDDKRAAALRVAYSEVLETLTEGGSLEAALNALIHSVEANCPNPLRGAVLLWEPPEQGETPVLRVAAAPSLPAPFHSGVFGTIRDPMESPSTRAIHEKRRVLVRDIRRARRYPDWVRRFLGGLGITSCWVQPILTANGDPLGTFVLYPASAGLPTRADIEMMESAARLVALAVNRARSEEALIRSEERYRSVVTQSSEGIFLVDLNSRRVLEANPALQSLLGYTAAEVADLTLYDIVAHRRDQVDRNVQRVRDHRMLDIGERQYRRRDGSHVAVEVSSSLVDVGGREVLCIVVHDLTARRESEQMVQHILSGANCLLWYATIRETGDADNPYDWRLKVSNLESAQTLLPLDASSYEDWEEAWFASRLPEENEQMDRLSREALRAGRGRYSQEFRCRACDGSLRWLREDVRLEPTGPGAWSAYGVCTDITERRRAEEQMEWQVTHDTLTHLPNRQLFRLRLDVLLANPASPVSAVLFLDLDRFKHINDTLGHAVGDRMLKQVARRLEHAVREGDLVARLGGDEFILLLPGIGSEQAALRMARKILKMVSRPVRIDDHELYATASIGLALLPRDGDDADTLLKHADVAMYRAKEDGGDSCRVYTPVMNASNLERLTMESDLRRALQRAEFALHYQPQFDLVSGRLTGVEALVRWNHPRHGMLSPGDFVNLAEETGLIVGLGEWVLREACRQGTAWASRGLKVRVSVNLSVRQFAQRDLAVRVDRILRETGFSPTMLDLELTETALLEHGGAAQEILEALKRLGPRLVVDDFGTGYSSLRYLSQFPIDVLKVDKSFVFGMAESERNVAIVRVVVDLAHALEMEVIAEGVETEEQKERLVTLGCDIVQGYLLSEPITADDMTAILEGSLLVPGSD